MEMIELKIEDEVSIKQLRRIALCIHPSKKEVKVRGQRNKAIYRLDNPIFCGVKRRYVNAITSARTVDLQVNQDGLKNREVPDFMKQEFKQLIRMVREKHLPEIPCPYTGKVALSFGNRGLNLLRFYPSS